MKLLRDDFEKMAKKMVTRFLKNNLILAVLKWIIYHNLKWIIPTRVEMYESFLNQTLRIFSKSFKTVFAEERFKLNSKIFFNFVLKVVNESQDNF